MPSNITDSTLYDVLDHGDPHALAVIIGSGGDKFTRQHIHFAAIQLADTLQNSGIVPGDIITIAEPNTVHYIVAFLGCTYARAVAAPLNQNYTQDEFAYYMEDAGSKLLLVGPAGNVAAEAAAQGPSLLLPVLSVALSSPTPHAQPHLDVALKFAPPPPPSTNTSSSSFLFSVAPPPDPIHPPSPSTADPITAAPTTTSTGAHRPTATDEALFLHTSGTTSKPKGVPLSHSNLMASIENIVDTYHFTSKDVSLLVMPLFHVHGLMAGLLSPLAAGASVVLPASGRFSATTFWTDAVDNNVTFYTAVPTIHQILLSSADNLYPKDCPPPLRFIRSCSSSLAPATLHQLEAAFGAPCLEAYAMTEASHQMTSNPLPLEGPHKPGTVGKAQGSVQVTILGPPPTFAPLPPNEVGEVCIKGPNVTAGYKNNPTANQDAFTPQGWFRTGDQGAVDEEGYVRLTGRLKELINRGGEKISPLEVDAVLLGHPWVAEAVSFGAPDEKYGEVVAAAVVLNDAGKKELGSGGEQVVVEHVRKYCGTKLAAFKVPQQVFMADELPKTATGKIQRRMMVEAFITNNSGSNGGGDDAQTKIQAKEKETKEEKVDLDAVLKKRVDGFFLAARSLHRLGIRYMFGVVGIPVTQLASAAQACGIRYIGCRNEQAAGYAAAAVGFLTGTPGVLLTVSGPGVVHGLAGLSDAQVNCWPMIMMSGSCERGEVGKGAFQELDQVAAVQPYVNLARRVDALSDIPVAITEAMEAAVGGVSGRGHGRPGAAYLDLPSDILMSSLSSSDTTNATKEEDIVDRYVPLNYEVKKQGADEGSLTTAVALLQSAKRPLIVIGKGAAYSRAEDALQSLVHATQFPFLATSMGRGVVGEDNSLCMNAARSLALSQCDVALIFGGRLNWQLHFGEPPKWSSDVKFILVDVAPTERDVALPSTAAVLKGDAGVVAEQLLDRMKVHPGGVSGNASMIEEGWVRGLGDKVKAATCRLEENLSAAAAAATTATTSSSLNYHTALRTIRDEILATALEPIVVSEGANTMDFARLILSPVIHPRSRLDAGTWGTMGVGPGYALAAAVTSPGTFFFSFFFFFLPVALTNTHTHTHTERGVVAVEGDSAFGFSAMEVETACRYNLPIAFVIFNNGGVYGGDRRDQELRELSQQGLGQAGYANDPAPTAFVPDARYDALATAFGGVGVKVDTQAALASALRQALDTKEPTVIDVRIDPMAGVESGNVHSFNAPKKE